MNQRPSSVPKTPKKGEFTLPPPVISMKTYINGLKQKIHEESARKDFTSSTAKDSIPALQTQVRHWINDTPRSLLERGWLIVDICGRLRGRYRQHPHPTKVAQILRMLGWQQVRSWTKDACGRRIWYPPGSKDLDL